VRDQAEENYQCVLVADWQREIASVVCALRVREATSFSLEEAY